MQVAVLLRNTLLELTRRRAILLNFPMPLTELNVNVGADSPRPRSVKKKPIGTVGTPKPKVLPLRTKDSARAAPSATVPPTCAPAPTPELYRLFKQREVKAKNARGPIGSQSARNRDSDVPSASPSKERPPSFRRPKDPAAAAPPPQPEEALREAEAPRMADGRSQTPTARTPLTGVVEASKGGQLLESVGSWINGLLLGTPHEATEATGVPPKKRSPLGALAEEDQRAEEVTAGEADGSAPSNAAPSRAVGRKLKGGWTAFVDPTTGHEYAVSPGWKSTAWVQRMSPVGAGEREEEEDDEDAATVIIPIEKPDDSSWSDSSSDCGASPQQHPFWTWTESLKRQLARQAEEGASPGSIFGTQLDTAGKVRDLGEGFAGGAPSVEREGAEEAAEPADLAAMAEEALPPAGGGGGGGAGEREMMPVWATPTPDWAEAMRDQVDALQAAVKQLQQQHQALAAQVVGGGADGGGGGGGGGGGSTAENVGGAAAARRRSEAEPPADIPLWAVAMRRQLEALQAVVGMQQEQLEAYAAHGGRPSGRRRSSMDALAPTVSLATPTSTSRKVPASKPRMTFHKKVWRAGR